MNGRCQICGGELTTGHSCAGHAGNSGGSLFTSTFSSDPMINVNTSLMLLSAKLDRIEAELRRLQTRLNSIEFGPA